MVTPLYRLVYRSSFLLPSIAERRQDEVAAILEVSQRRNAASGLTGALLHAGEAIVQVLEGPLEALEETYDRISADLRHTGLVLLQLVPVAERSFPDWWMALVPPEALDAAWPELGRGAALGVEDVSRMVALLANALPGPRQPAAA